MAKKDQQSFKATGICPEGCGKHFSGQSSASSKHAKEVLERNIKVHVAYYHRKG